MGARNLIPYLNVQENVELPMTLAGIQQPHQRAEELLGMVGLADRKRSYVSHLSGGEQQRVAIAVSLANAPSILLADEPTGELDTATAHIIYDAFRTLNQKLGLTILIVSHDPAIAQQVNRVMAIRDGKAASETVRRRSNNQPTNLSSTQHDEDRFEELTVVDSVGRLQIPKAYREKLKMGKRAQLELVENGVLVRPMADEQPSVSSEASKGPSGAKDQWKNWLHLLLKRGK
jgi:ABC-type methionine transport system ATPase subunit